jgi:indolepyruvate ferredoxin oxidoreductase alpha subunit
MKLVERELEPHHVSCDIGCHLFSVLPPFSIGSSTMGYRLGELERLPSTRSRASVPLRWWRRRVLAQRACLELQQRRLQQERQRRVVVDNGYSAATGERAAVLRRRQCAAGGQKPDREGGARRRYRLGTHRQAHLRRGQDARPPEGGADRGGETKVIIAQSECMLNKQRRERPLMRKRVQTGERVVRERFGVDPDTCTGDPPASGCPGAALRLLPIPIRCGAAFTR